MNIRTLLLSILFMAGVPCTQLYGMESKQISAQMRRQVCNFVWGSIKPAVNQQFRSRANRMPLLDSLAPMCTQLEQDIIKNLNARNNKPEPSIEQQNKTVRETIDRLKEKKILNPSDIKKLEHNINISKIHQVKESYTLKELVAQIRSNIAHLKQNPTAPIPSLAKQFAHKKCADMEYDFQIWTAALVVTEGEPLLNKAVMDNLFVDNLENTLKQIDILILAAYLKLTSSKVVPYLNTLLTPLNALAHDYRSSHMKMFIDDVERQVTMDTTSFIFKKVYLPRIGIGAAVIAGLGIVGTIAYAIYKHKKHA